LTLASDAHLGESEAFPGLSVVGGQLAVRAGPPILTLGEKTEVELIPFESGLHADMSAGSVHFSAAENELVEVHALDAIVRPAGALATQSFVTILVPDALQITAVHGNLAFSYRDEFRKLPQGQTERIYLHDSTGSSNTGAGSEGPQKPGIHEAIRSENGDESPAKP
jgi:hypothetical protein